MAYGLQGEGLLWLIGAVVCLLAANYGSDCSLTLAVDDRIGHCGIISSCQSVAISEIVKVRLMSYMRRTMASTGLYLYHYEVLSAVLHRHCDITLTPPSMVYSVLNDCARLQGAKKLWLYINRLNLRVISNVPATSALTPVGAV